MSLRPGQPASIPICKYTLMFRAPYGTKSWEFNTNYVFERKNAKHYFRQANVVFDFSKLANTLVIGQRCHLCVPSCKDCYVLICLINNQSFVIIDQVFLLITLQKPFTMHWIVVTLLVGVASDIGKYCLL